MVNNLEKEYFKGHQAIGQRSIMSTMGLGLICARGSELFTFWFPFLEGLGYQF